MSISGKNLRFSLDTNPNIGYNLPMFYEKIVKSGINRKFFALLLAIMWLSPFVFGWVAYETHGHHMKFAFAVCSVACLLDAYALTFIFGGLNYIRSRT